MKNLILTALACTVHIGIHQVVHHYSLIGEAANRNLLYISLASVLIVSANIGYTLNYFYETN